MSDKKTPLMIVLATPCDSLQELVTTGALVMALSCEGPRHANCVCYEAEKCGESVIHKVTFAGVTVAEAHVTLAEMLGDWAKAFDQQRVVDTIRSGPDGVAAAAAPVDRSKMN